jgi:hypothetical protein
LSPESRNCSTRGMSEIIRKCHRHWNVINNAVVDTAVQS